MENENQNVGTMPVYKCHKEVRALQIESATRTSGQLKLEFKDQDRADLLVHMQEMKGKPMPQGDWYLIVYNDGYFSFSPPEAFESGYTLKVD